jgi:TRAP-type uncharacterized transport system fused permease subunit
LHYLAYAGASIAGSDPFKTGFTAVRLGLVAFIVPFMFYSSGEQMLSGPSQIYLIASITSIIGTFVLGASLQGWLCGPLNIFLRGIAIFFAAVMTINPGPASDLIGLAILICVYLYQRQVFRRNTSAV